MIVSICRCWCAVALRSPKGMKFHTYCPDAVTNAVFSLDVAFPGPPSASHIRVCQKDDVRSCDDSHSAPAMAINVASIRGSG